MAVEIRPLRKHSGRITDHPVPIDPDAAWAAAERAIPALAGELSSRPLDSTPSDTRCTDWLQTDHAVPPHATTTPPRERCTKIGDGCVTATGYAATAL
jgi:hypothetical protein